MSICSQLVFNRDLTQFQTKPVSKEEETQIRQTLSECTKFKATENIGLNLPSFGFKRQLLQSADLDMRRETPLESENGGGRMLRLMYLIGLGLLTILVAISVQAPSSVPTYPGSSPISSSISSPIDLAEESDLALVKNQTISEQLPYADLFKLEVSISGTMVTPQEIADAKTLLQLVAAPAPVAFTDQNFDAYTLAEMFDMLQKLEESKDPTNNFLNARTMGHVITTRFEEEINISTFSDDDLAKAHQVFRGSRNLRKTMTAADLNREFNRRNELRKTKLEKALFDMSDEELYAMLPTADNPTDIHRALAQHLLRQLPSDTYFWKETLQVMGETLSMELNVILDQEVKKLYIQGMEEKIIATWNTPTYENMLNVCQSRPLFFGRQLQSIETGEWFARAQGIPVYYEEAIKSKLLPLSGAGERKNLTNLPSMFTNVQQIGRGADGHVYRALYQGRVVSVKVPSEGNVVAMNHPHIVKIEQTTSKDYQVQEFIEGQSIQALCAHADKFNLHGIDFLGLEGFWSLALQLYDTLLYMQSQEIVHSDLKPGNVMVTFNPDGVDSKVIDIGRAVKGHPRTGQTRLNYPAQSYDITMGNTMADEVFAMSTVLAILWTSPNNHAEIRGHFRPGQLPSNIEVFFHGTMQTDPRARLTAKQARQYAYEQLAAL